MGARAPARAPRAPHTRPRSCSRRVPRPQPLRPASHARPQPRPAPPRRVASAASGNGTGGRMGGVTDPAVELVDGAVTSGPDLSVEVNGLRLPNPFVIGSGPPGTNYQVRVRGRV
jgi:dihydropyrimidine dehydrogenase (NADP+)